MKTEGTNVICNFFLVCLFLSLESVEIIADKTKNHNLHIWNYNRKINQMKHLLINEAYFIISSVNDKKISAQLLHLKK